MGASQSSADLDSEKAAWVKQQIDNACVVIFSKTTCPYCRMAKKVFSDIGQETNVIELNQRSDGGEIQDILYQMTGASTVPRVFVNGKCIGGGEETRSLHQSGQLVPMLRSC